MFLTAQIKLEFKPEDQQAMDRRLRYYYFKSLPNPKQKATQLLLKHPMECIAWAALKASTPIDEEESSEDEVVERNPQDDEGSLPGCEKEILRTLEQADFLTNSSEKQHA